MTSFVLYGLLEASELKTIKLDDHQFSQSLMAINQFRDKNSPSGLPQYSFWPQTLVNGTWSATPQNLFGIVNHILPQTMPFALIVFFQLIGLGVLDFAYAAKFEFVIPPDTDDSSVNLALLAFLKETKSKHYEFWNSLNFKKKQFYERALKYAYRPFGPNMTLNHRADEIDPRTYFAIRGFLDELKHNATQNNVEPELILPTTWMLTFDERVAKI